MGFWQNKNGQAPSPGARPGRRAACSSNDPFNNCATAPLATYVTNVMKAASASGATMNAMLKAQMLSTALDVYFGKVSGSVKIDLRHQQADRQQHVREHEAAFGNSICLSVNDLLTYASGQSNIGGSIWYAQVKATQELAKDTFDAINNTVAFSC